MDYQQAVAYLDAHIGLGGEPGLQRIRGLLDDMGDPHLGYPVIHVAGTNGKTSTTRFATLLCIAHGLNTGTCISPHLQRIEERYGANGQFATADEFAQAITDGVPAVAAGAVPCTPSGAVAGVSEAGVSLPSPPHAETISGKATAASKRAG